MISHTVVHLPVMTPEERVDNQAKGRLARYSRIKKCYKRAYSDRPGQSSDIVFSLFHGKGLSCPDPG
jgi:hypothetical protein